MATGDDRGRGTAIPYETGLHEVADGVFAYLQPDGGWGWSNAGLFATRDSSLLVDTLFDQVLTRQMLDAMEPVTATRPIDTVVNTHANGDHCYGNGLLEGAEIVTTEAAAREMGAVPPSALVALLQADLDPVTAEYIQEAFGDFEFGGITIPEPTQTFSGRLELKLGDHPVHLEQVGPAHTAGDLIVHLPDESTVFTGDILFVNGTPIVWDGPIANWVAACDRILELGCDVIVPGHGPLTDAGGVLAVRDYLTWLEDACRSRHKEGLAAADTISDLATSEEFAPYREWGEWERLAVNVRAAYREIDGDDGTIPSSFVEMAAEMAMLAAGG
ncbi:MAG: MBL fold metallo-hydrolase [Actinomycetota bacterium]|nr:MBL fold metallo-hydrolase [Acidimicrobiales bacterium]MEC9448807.1 MBL fold metallo-hydrolase [Actinomycetota bacterium]MED5437950.1 MBL fold metallo-hydrolase [Actinomycetota bacterium]